MILKILSKADGSTGVVDEHGNEIENIVSIEWSIEAGRYATCKITFNDMPINAEVDSDHAIMSPIRYPEPYPIDDRVISHRRMEISPKDKLYQSQIYDLNKKYEQLMERMLRDSGEITEKIDRGNKQPNSKWYKP